MKKLYALAILIGLAAPAAAASSYTLGPTISTTTGRLTQSMAGTFNLSAASTTISTPTITLNGATGEIAAKLPCYDVKIAGAKCDGTTDDTTAIQNAINAAAGATAGAHAAQSACVALPAGTCVISSSLYYIGWVSYSLHLKGIDGGGRGVAGTTLKWNGALGGTLFVTDGANETTIDDIRFDGNGVAKYAFNVSASNSYASFTLNTTITPGFKTVTPSAISLITTGTIVGVDSGANFEFIRVSSMAGANSFKATFLKSHAATAGFASNAGSSGVTFRRDSFANAIGTSSTVGQGSAQVLIGNFIGNGSSNQVSEVQFQNCNILGYATDGSQNDYGLLIISGGNTKNFSYKQGKITDANTLVGWLGTSGTLSITGTILANSHLVDISAGTGVLLVQGTESESSFGTSFIGGSTGANPGNVTLISNSWQGTAGSTDVVINFPGNLTMYANEFFNNRCSTCVAYVLNGNADPSTNSMGSINSGGNYFQGASGYAPFYYSSGVNQLIPTFGTSLRAANVVSLNDTGGIAGALTKLNGYIAADKFAYLHSVNVSSTGIVAVGDTDLAVAFRNHANNGDIQGLTKTTGDVVVVGDTSGTSIPGPLKPFQRTKAQLAAITPAVGDTYICSDCTLTYDVVVGTGATPNGFRETGTNHGAQ